MPSANSNRTLVELEGVNGNWFTLSGPGMGAEGVWLGTNVEGIYDAPVKTIWTEHAHQIGASFAAMRNLRRDIVFDVTIGDTSSLTWQEADSEWRKAWSYEDDCKLWIETADSRRYLKLRLSEQPLFKPERDPNIMQVERVTMTCIAGEPWWLEEDAVDSWVSTVDTNVADGQGVYPTQSGTVTVENPTDQEIWLKWVLQGPGRWTLPDFSFGDNRFDRDTLDAARKIVMPVQAPGQTFLVNTDPFEDLLRDPSGSQVWSLMNGVTFCYPIPPYTKKIDLPVSVSQSVAGAGVQVRMPRTWSRPWGLQ